MGFNLFDAEDKLLKDAEALETLLSGAAPELRQGVATLVEAFRRGVREQRRLVKVSDRQQEQLSTLNQELAKRRAEAEEALERLKQAQESLIQSEKLASLGALVAGVAHEINTPVGIALSCASHLADATRDMQALFEKDDIGVEDFERYMATASDTARLILGNCERAASLIRSFKQVAVDRTSSERRRFDLKSVIEETLESLKPQIRLGGHQAEIDCPPGIVIDGYPGALSQVLANLAQNALAHAFDSGTSGLLRIEACALEAGRVRLVFADNGKGIPPQHLGRIFDPFFTTKRGAGGSGLGLHIVYNLVTGPLGGAIDVASAPGQGTRFTLDIALSPLS
jgi:two-component system NtrC family sensor kinase